MSQIFISYSHIDKTFVRPLAENLRLVYGHDDVWYDDRVYGGQVFWNEILSAIQACDVFLYFMSPEANASDWCSRERNHARKLGKYVIPVLVRQRTLIPEDLKDVLYIDMSNGSNDMDAFAKLFGAINKFLEEETQNNRVFEPTVKLTASDAVTEIATSPASHILVEAGPGTGKTHSLLARVTQLLKNGIDPETILIVTFTRRAAIEIQEKLSELRVTGATKVYAGTLHSFCFRMLMHANYYLQSDRRTRILLEFEERFLLEDLKSEGDFGKYHDRKRRLKAFEAAWAREQYHEPDEYTDDLDQAFESALLDWLIFHEAMLLDEIVKETIRYLRSNPASPELTRFSHVLVDEYQDLNRADQALIDLISQNGKLTAIGDRHQSIYTTLRYAHPEGMVEFGRTYEDTHHVSINVCHRCATRIVEVANQLISGQKLVAKPENGPGEIHVVNWGTIEEEAKGIARFISERIVRGDFHPGQVLILSPRRLFGYKIRDVLQDEFGQQVHSFFREQLLESNEAKEALTLLQLAVNPNDRVALRSWLGLGHSTLNYRAYQRVRQTCERLDRRPRELLDDILNENYSLSHISGLLDRYRELREWETAWDDQSDREKFDLIFPQTLDWTQQFRELTDTSNKEETLAEMLERIRDHITQPDMSLDVPHIRIMSLHSSKGLTADHVFVLGCIDGLIPQAGNTDLSWQERQRISEEQRRLFYVAVTRAKSTLVLSSAETIPRKIAHNIGLSVPRNYGDLRTVTSKFIRDDLKDVLPKPVGGHLWRY